MVTLTNGEVIQAEIAVRELARERVAFASAMKVRRMMRELKGLADDVRAEERKVAEPHLKHDERGELAREQGADGQEVVPFASPEDRAAYSREYAELMATEVVYDGEPLKAGELGLAEVKPEVLLALGPLLTD
jgi:hypothetical protein